MKELNDMQIPARRWPRYPVPPLWMTLIFLAFVVARYIGLNQRMDILSTIRAEFLLGLASTACGILQLAHNPLRIGHGKYLLWSTITLFLLISIQVPIARDPIMAPVVYTNRVFKFALLTFMILALVRDPRSLRWFIAAFLFSMFYVTEETVEGLITGSLIWESQGVMRLHGAVAMYGHPNSLGGVSLGVLPFFWYLFPVVKRRILRVALIATATTSATCVLYSGSRTAYVGFLVFVGWIVVQSRYRVKLIGALIVVTIAISPIVPDQYIERFASIAGQEAEGNSKQTRIQILEDAWRVFVENPLGVGVASFPAVRSEMFGRSQDTHNLYLEVATNIGIQGLLAFAAFIGTMLALLASTAGSLTRQCRQIRSLAAGAGIDRRSRMRMYAHWRDLEFTRRTAVAVACFIVLRLVVGFFGMDLYEIYWWFGAGLAFATSALSSSMAIRTRMFALESSEPLDPSRLEVSSQASTEL